MVTDKEKELAVLGVFAVIGFMATIYIFIAGISWFCEHVRFV